MSGLQIGNEKSQDEITMTLMLQINMHRNATAHELLVLVAAYYQYSSVSNIGTRIQLHDI